MPLLHHPPHVCMFFPDRVLYPLIVLVSLQRKELICGPHLIAVGQSKNYGSIAGGPIVATVDSAPVGHVEAREAMLVGQCDVFGILVHTKEYRSVWAYLAFQRVKEPREAGLNVRDHGGL